MTEEHTKIISMHFFRRTAQAKERKLTRELSAASMYKPSIRVPASRWLKDEGVPNWAQGFRVQKAWRGPFMWSVVATDHVGH